MKKMGHEIAQGSYESGFKGALVGRLCDVFKV